MDTHPETNEFFKGGLKLIFRGFFEQNCSLFIIQTPSLVSYWDMWVTVSYTNMHRICEENVNTKKVLKNGRKCKSQLLRDNEKVK